MFYHNHSLCCTFSHGKSPFVISTDQMESLPLHQSVLISHQISTLNAMVYLHVEVIKILSLRLFDWCNVVVVGQHH